jgi:rRNA maturation protein Nop10
MLENLIDVHILHMPTENQEWWKLCEESLVDHPINIYHCEGVPGNPGEARVLAYKNGNAPYVSFVDPDDIVMPGAFQKCLDGIEQNPDVCGVYTLSEEIDKDGKQVLKVLHPYRPWSLFHMRMNIVEIHQIAVMRREDVEIYHTEIYPSLPNTGTYHNTMMYLQMATKKPWMAIDHVGYKWRNHSAGVHNIFREDKNDTSREDTYKIMNKIYYDNMSKL